MGRKRRDEIAQSSPAAVLEDKRVPASGCRHYWIIEPPNGATSRGRCRFCGQEREFDNLGPDSWRYGDMSELLATILPDIKGEDD